MLIFWEFPPSQWHVVWCHAAAEDFPCHVYTWRSKSHLIDAKESLPLTVLYICKLMLRTNWSFDLGEYLSFPFPANCSLYLRAPCFQEIKLLIANSIWSKSWISGWREITCLQGNSMQCFLVQKAVCVIHLPAWNTSHASSCIYFESLPSSFPSITAYI